jgi:hypothetical protein
VSRRKNSRPPLLMRVWAELGRGHITEDVTLTSDVKGERLHGVKCGRHIWINPVWAIVDTAVHELLHRLHPEWSERYVRRTTAFLMNRMTDAEAQTFYDEYQKRAKKPKRTRREAE